MISSEFSCDRPGDFFVISYSNLSQSNQPSRLFGPDLAPPPNVKQDLGRSLVSLNLSDGVNPTGRCRNPRSRRQKDLALGFFCTNENSRTQCYRR